MKNTKVRALFLSGLGLIVFISGCGTTQKPATNNPSVIAQTSATSIPQESVIKPSTTANVPVANLSQTPTTTQWPAVTVTQLGDPPDLTYTVRILLADGNLDPKVVTIPAGTKVIWWTTEHWVDQTLKTDDGVVLGTPFLFRALEYIFSAPGTYNYYNDFSPWVKGTIIVY